ncbi:esterase-like activity of phytase family protein [Ferruginibacter paludis]|uniref:esterase-like activity of phytase family protein n=1 Tax=Ferruginibacter paludis TaxID=1310417 RepID=UPI0025B3C333|nr:esterase-like activity of phytase family protein [Ferruginibacter paludis]MDN3656311.1 esterase-like activity of phytase family protein [Ferruginibacter paludis]
MHLIKLYSTFLIAFVVFASCNGSKKLAPVAGTAGVGTLHFLGEKDIPYNLLYNNTTVGGLSGIDYDTAGKTYYLISDDRSAINPARFYTADIDFSSKGIDSIYFTGVHSLLQPDGKPYPSSKQDAVHTPDPETIRYNPLSKQLVWSSEGERIVNAKDTVLENPEVNTISTTGDYIANYKLPTNLAMQSTLKGPRQNGVLEGMSFADNYKTLFVNVEEPLYEDGPRADVTANNAFIRLLKFDVATLQNTAQYAYKLEPVAYPAVPANAFKINGVPDILSLGNNQFLVIERSFSSGRLPCTIKVFLADLSAATDVTNMTLMNAGKSFTPIAKKLLLNMDDLGIYIDNIEGVTFGPDLPNGHKTLLFISDNNFNVFEKTQLLLFEVTGY